MLAASSFEAPSLTVPGAPSTRSLASFRPRLVTSRTTLIVLILSPAAARTTVNSVCSSTAGAAAAPAAAPAAAIGTAIAAAETPNFSSSALTRPFNSSTVMLSTSLTKFSAVIAICPSPLRSRLQNSFTANGFGRRRRLRLLIGNLGHDQCQIAYRTVQYRHQSAQGRLDQEQQPVDELLTARQLRDRRDLFRLDAPSFDDRPLVDELRVRLRKGGQDLGQGHRVVFVVGDRGRPHEVLRHRLERRPLGRLERESVLHHDVLGPRVSDLAAQLRDLRDLQPGKSHHHRVPGLCQVGPEDRDSLFLFVSLHRPLLQRLARPAVYLTARAHPPG